MKIDTTGKTFTQVFNEWLTGYRHRTTSPVNPKPASDQPNVTVLLTALVANDWHCNTPNPELRGFMRIYRFTKPDKEIEIHIHNNKGDLYGVFQRLNENRLPVIIDTLTDSLADPVVTATEIVNNVVKGMQTSMDTGTPPIIDLMQEQLRRAVTLLRR